MRSWRQAKRPSRGWALVALAVGCAIVIAAALLAPYGSTSAEPIVPEGLAVARVVGEAADVVVWDGETWRQVVSPTSLAPLEHEGVSHRPRVLAVVPAPGHLAYGLLVAYCAAGGAESGACVSRGYVYDVPTGELRQIGGGDPVAPVGWMDEGTELLVAEPLLGRGSVYDLASGSLTALQAPEQVYTLPRSPGAVSYETGSVAFSSPSGEGLLRIASGGTTWLEGPASAYDTAWIAISPTSGVVAAVRIQEDQDNNLGAGMLTLLDGTGATLAEVTPSGQLDFSPAWADQGRQVVFLRAAAGDVLGDFNEASDESPPASSVLAYDVEAGTYEVVTPPDAARGDLLAPGAGHTAVFLQYDGGQRRAHGVDIRGGQPGPLGAGGDEHTAIGWAAP